MHEAETRSCEVLWSVQRNLNFAPALPILNNRKDFHSFVRSEIRDRVSYDYPGEMT